MFNQYKGVPKDLSYNDIKSFHLNKNAYKHIASQYIHPTKDYEDKNFFGFENINNIKQVSTNFISHVNLLEDEIVVKEIQRQEEILRNKPKERKGVVKS